MVKNPFKKKGGYNSSDVDRKQITGLAKGRIPKLGQLKYIGRFLSKTEKYAALAALVLLVGGLGWLAVNFTRSNLEASPVAGGKYIEGMVGAPKYINPLYANLNNVDADLANLVYSSLFKRDKNGFLAPDLVKEYQVSQDKTEYTFWLKPRARWHNGEKVTSRDVIFTLNTITDPNYQSPLRPLFNRVRSEVIDDESFKLILNEPYAPFMESLTFGILPQKLWSDVSPYSAPLAQLNIKPIGSGPFKFQGLTKNSNGQIFSMTFAANEDYYEKTPYLDEIEFRFFVNKPEMFDSLNNNRIDGISYLTAADLDQILSLNSFNLREVRFPQMYGIFFNLNADSAADDSEVRRALALAIDKAALTDAVYGRYAKIIDSPILPGIFGHTEEVEKYDYNPEAAATALEEAGWSFPETDDETETSDSKTGEWRRQDGNDLTITLTTINRREYIRTAEIIRDYWDAIGVKTEVRLIEAQDATAAITNKNYTAFLYSIKQGIDPDPYSVWHSNQADNGFNLTGYDNEEVDELLTEARTNHNIEVRRKNYEQFQKMITGDLPAIFLFSPDYLYLQDKKVKGFETEMIQSPENRFDRANYWYTKERKKLKL